MFSETLVKLLDQKLVERPDLEKWQKHDDEQLEESDVAADLICPVKYRVNSPLNFVHFQAKIQHEPAAEIVG